MMFDPRCTEDNRTWRQFEKEVCDIYELMGYRVEHDVVIEGQQIDVLATREMPGAQDIRLMIDTKHKVKGNADNDDVFSVRQAFRALQADGIVQGCVIVTSNGFTPAAVAAAKSARISLKTKTQLLRELLDFSRYTRTLRSEYEDQFGTGKQTWYIPTRGRLPHSEADDLDAIVDAWLQSPGRKPLAILGGYGTGKSSFCTHYALRLADRLEGPIPIILRLRDFYRHTDLNALIRTLLDEEIRAASPRFEVFWRMFEEGLILLFLDGLDEMLIRVDEAGLEGNLEEIERFVKVSPNVILTCRPEHFVSNREQIVALRPEVGWHSSRKTEYQPLEVELWNTGQITAFVKKRLATLTTPEGDSAEYYTDQIFSTPHFADVASRAVHLDLLVKMLPTLVLGGITVNRVNLYHEYVKGELTRDKVKHRYLTRLSDEQRLELLTSIAWRSLIGGASALDFDSAREIVQNELTPRPTPAEAVQITREFLARSFLMRKNDSYIFAHKSIAEYLFAREAHGRLANRSREFLRTARHVTPATCGMVLELFGTDDDGVDRFLDRLGLEGRNVGSPFLTTAIRVFEPGMLHAVAFAMHAFIDYLDPSGTYQVGLTAGHTSGNTALDDLIDFRPRVLGATKSLRERYYVPDRQLVSVADRWARIRKRALSGELLRTMNSTPET